MVDGLASHAHFKSLYLILLGPRADQLVVVRSALVTLSVVMGVHIWDCSSGWSVS
jgi:hypothetical protein